MTRSVALIALILAGALGLAATGRAQTPALPRVVATINPIHALVAGVMDGVGKPELILHGNASPYGYQIRSGEARILNRADMVVFVAEGYETFLIRSLETLPPDSRVVELIAIDGLTLLQPRRGAAWEDEARPGAPKNADGAGESGPGAEAPDPDPNIWLDPTNAAAMVSDLADELADADPQREPIYHRNAEALLKRLQDLDRELMEAMRPLHDLPFMVVHDGFQYFEKHYGLTAVGAVGVRPDQRPSAKRFKDVHDKLAQMGAVCLFTEPQMPPGPIRALTDGTKAKTAVLDPLAGGAPETVEAYFIMMRGLAGTYRGCLAPKG
jgi:zinc transport system substrate-binding protein